MNELHLQDKFLIRFFQRRGVKSLTTIIQDPL